MKKKEGVESTRKFNAFLKQVKSSALSTTVDLLQESSPLFFCFTTFKAAHFSIILSLQTY